MRAALFGGTFDPIHVGHIALARALADKLDLSRVLLMPTAQPPHKLKDGMASGEDRAAMCRLAAQEDARLEVSDLELRRGGASFTADTLDALAEQYPDAEWYLLTGADMFLTLGTWFRFSDIAKRAVLCAVPRDDVTREQLEAYAAVLTQAGARCVVEDIAVPTVSSTELRRRLRCGEPTDGLLSPAVEAYIREHHLYTEASDTLPQETQLKEILRRRLTPARFAHSLAVADEAERLAQKYGADRAKARTAGLLHDILKDTDRTEQLQIAKDFGILLDDVEKDAPSLWHARLGSVFLEKILGITDAEILSAVRYHTTGKAHMTLLEEIVFVADLTAEGRQYNDVEVVRELANRSLDEAAEYILRWLVGDLTAKGRTVHPDTQRALEQLSGKG